MDITINKPKRWLHGFIFGLVAILDGLVRVLTIGIVSTNFQLEYAKATALRRIVR